MKINEVEKVLREHRFICHKAGLDTTKIDSGIKIWKDIKNGKNVKKSKLLRLIAEIMEANPKCAETIVTPEFIASLLRILFPEYLRGK